MVNIVNNDFNIQDFRNLENVNQDNVNNLSSNKDMRLSGYMDNYSTLNSTRTSTSVQTGSICSGVGSIGAMGYLPARFGQSGNTLTFTLYPGQIRFLDQAVSYASSLYTQNQATMARFQGTADSTGAGNSITQTFSLASGTPVINIHYYVVAILDTATVDAYNNTLTCTIPATNLILLSDLQINQDSTNPTYVALFKVNTSDGTNYTVSVDEYCANNYNCLTQTQISALLPNGYRIDGNEDLPVNITHTTSNCTVDDFTYIYRKYSNGNTILNLYGTGIVNIYYIIANNGTFIPIIIGGQIKFNLYNNILQAIGVQSYTNKKYNYNMNVPGNTNSYVAAISLGNYNPNDTTQSRDCPSRVLSTSLPLFQICDSNYTDIVINLNFLGNNGSGSEPGGEGDYIPISYEFDIQFELTNNL